jgi:hypothetical protein
MNYEPARAVISDDGPLVRWRMHHRAGSIGC